MGFVALCVAVWICCGVLMWGLIAVVIFLSRKNGEELVAKSTDEKLEHYDDGRECWCNPTIQPIKNPDGSIDWMTTHRDLVKELMDETKKV